MSNTTNITKEAAAELFAALGVPSAAKWNAKRLEAKLNKVDEMVDDDTELSGNAKNTLTAVLAALEGGGTVTIGTDVPAAKAKAAPAEKPAPKGKAKETAHAEKPAPKAAKPKPKAEGPDIPGVREVNSRAFVAGQIIAKYGLAAGVTEEMIDELDDTYGKVNPVESAFCLRNAWHAIRGAKAVKK